MRLVAFGVRMMTSICISPVGQDVSQEWMAPNLEPPEVVLIIDRRALERDCLRFYLASMGYRVLAHRDVASWKAAEHPTSRSVTLIFNDTGTEALSEEVTELLEGSDANLVLIMSPVGGLPFAIDAIERGAGGYLPTGSSIQDVVGAIRLVWAGSKYMPTICVLNAKIVTSRDPESLKWKGHFTTKQAAVIEGVRLGKPNKIIAYELNMCESTVKVHIRNVMKKLNVRNRTELAFKATQFSHA